MIRLVAVVLLLWAAPAQAHKLRLFVTVEGTALVGSAYFSGGGKAMGGAGMAQAPDGSVLERFATAEDGSFRLTARARMDHILSVDSGDGHVATVVVAAEELPASLPMGPASRGRDAAAPDLPPGTGMEAVEAAVARQIRPLRQQLDAYEDKVRLHDVLGGIGTIFGVFGIAAWIAARRRAS